MSCQLCACAIGSTISDPNAPATNGSTSRFILAASCKSYCNSASTRALTLELQMPSACRSNNADPMPEKMRMYGTRLFPAKSAMRKDFDPIQQSAVTHLACHRPHYMLVRKLLRHLPEDMTSLFPELTPYAHGMLDVGDGNLLYFETCGNPRGKPAVVLHGGPGSGCTSWHRRLFDPDTYRIVIFDQRNCGRSKPNASAHDTDLTSNHTANLIKDLEQLRQHLAIDKWMLLGGSWGST